MKKLIIAILLLFAGALPLQADPSENYKTSKDCTSGVDGAQCTATNVVISSGLNTWLYVWVHGNAASSQDDGCLWNGSEAMTRQGGIINGTATMYVDFYSLQAPTATTDDLQCSYDTAINSALGILAVDGIEAIRSVEFADFNGNQEAVASVAVTSVVGDWVIAGFSVRTSTCTNYNIGTQLYDDVPFPSGRNGCGIRMVADDTLAEMNIDLSAAAYLASAVAILEPSVDEEGNDDDLFIQQITNNNRRNSHD